MYNCHTKLENFADVNQLFLHKTNSNGSERNPEWFSQWFGTEFYHQLYSNRSMAEAELFITALRKMPWFNAHINVLDLGCGNGRHSYSIAPFVHFVDGVDLSDQQLEIARSLDLAPNCAFHKFDMRNFQLNKQYELIVNLFTSFGYFETESEHLLVLKQVQKHLSKGGRFVLDYFNSSWVQENLNPTEIKTINNTQYEITRSVVDNRIVKLIKVGNQLFKEDVALLDLNDFLKLFKKCGFIIESVAGDYNLNEFDKDSSQRCIIFARTI